MIDAQRIALLREEFGYHADVAFATAESGACRHKGEAAASSPTQEHLEERCAAHPASNSELGEVDYVIA